eukprot:TRINITY_DN3669_c1_g1_i7.p2 TRINITY_DN3669_c1_g1~~TRINITY_DN3669_c1_g1_i7.p2  ORF type:complete len:100 (-),score=15.79 TRINITY_DN3669_c1_g1_i7:260-559(-)
MPRGFFFSCFFPRWVETAWWEEEEEEYSLYARLAQDMEHGRVEVIDVDASSDTTTVSAASTITEETFSVSSDSSVEMLPSLTQQRLDDAAARRAAEGNS